jgi:hypothetical protein
MDIAFNRTIVRYVSILRAVVSILLVPVVSMRNHSCELALNHILLVLSIPAHGVLQVLVKSFLSKGEGSYCNCTFQVRNGTGGIEFHFSVLNRYIEWHAYNCVVYICITWHTCTLLSPPRRSTYTMHTQDSRGFWNHSLMTADVYMPVFSFS